MRYWVYGDGSFTVMLGDLIAFAWLAPMRDLAAQIGMTDTGLRKLLKAQGVILPEQGYWNKLRAGKLTPVLPKTPPRRPGESQRIRLDGRFAGKVSPAPPISAEGPFASIEVPEDLDALLDRERAAIGRVAVPRDLSKPAPGLRRLLQSEERRRQRFAKSRYSWDAPLFDGPLAQRKLRILNGLFHALHKRGCHGEVYEHQYELQASVQVGEQCVRLSFSTLSSYKTVMRHGRREPAEELSAGTPLKLSLHITMRHKMQLSWSDTKDSRLESCLSEVAAAIIVAGEAGYRASLWEHIEMLEKRRRQEEAERQARIAEASAARLAALKESGDLLRKAEDIRSLIARVKTAVEAGVRKVPPQQLADWEAWANGYADSLDPVLSGHVLRHIAPSTPN
ncbi:hypothetical protein [Sandarakinorhabdus rubra]|uniref:hypothetical protein n=1 Tax=Sandarakinorhabdus rubra TaxID=2672568 RepID=UPI0013DD519F|nr:hypothetical protein [Sandarakinorhabdus rubra]